MSETTTIARLFRGEAAARLPMLMDDADQRWRQVVSRDAGADGAFVYAVRTTGIFCRPSCPSRRPLARHVAFFATPDDARRAGFRACLRCKPENVRDRCGDMVARAAEVLLDQAGHPVALQDLAQATGTGRLSVMRGFRKVLGVTPNEFVRGQKLRKFADAMQRNAINNGSASITDAIYEAGFGSSSRLYESSEQTLGMTPGAMRKAGAGTVIRYATASTPLGRMLVGATDAGVCAILFADDDASLLGDLRRRFSRAELIPSQQDDGWFAEAVAYVASQTTEHPLAATFPLDVRATAFQLRVWKALREIPRGQTRSYSDVARQIGRPQAVRAVGAAIGANPIAVAVPCHRVVGKDGSMTGYRWGIERKQKLLAAEAARARNGEPALE